MRSPIRLAQTALVQRSENGDSSAAVLEDTTELSDVSFLSRDREHLESGKFYSDDSDEELVVEQRRRKALCYSLSCCGMCVLFGLFVAFHSFSTGPMSVWTSASAWGEPMQEFPFLGEGLCLGRANQLIPKYNTSGDLMQFFQPASPEQCQAQCQQDAQCSGFVTHGNTTCSLISEEEGFPAAADATPRFRCYWRHDFLHNSVGIYDPPRPLVPKVIWSYWENVHQVDANLTQQAIMHAFLELCQKSWRTLNPGWEIRVLDQDTVWQYISKADLPAGFDNLKVQHRSDAIRLALLVEYGGVWMDATLLLLRPLSMVIQDIDPSNRFFYVNRGLLGIPIINTKYDRYTADFHVENWFFAAPQQDPLLVRTFSCVKKMHQEGDTKHLSDYGNLFTQRQLEDLDALAEWAYLATDACIFKALDEDRALTQWWLSPSVHRRNFLGHLNPLWFQNPNQTLIDIFYRVNPEIVQTLTGGALLLLKFTTDMRKALLEPLSPLELYGCVESSWSIVLAAIGIANITKCEELRKPGAFGASEHAHARHGAYPPGRSRPIAAAAAMPSQLLHGDLASPASTPPLGDDFAEEMRDLRNFIEASFVKQSLHFEEIMESLRHESLRQAPQPKRQPTAVSTLARAGFRKSYSTTTLETEIMDMSADIEDETETAIIRPPKRPSVHEERFGVEEPSTHRVSGALQVPVSGTREGSKTNSDVTEDEVQDADSSASKGKTARFSDEPRPGARTPRPTSHSRSISEDTFVQSNMRKTMKSAEAAIETSIGSMKRFSQGLNRADTLEIDVSEISRWRHFCLRVVSANAFTNCIMLLILVNLVLLGVEIQVATTLGQFDVPRWFGIINTVIVCIFILEISLKFVAYGVKGLLCGKDAFWNNLDFLVIAASVLETAVEIWDLSLSATHGTSSAHLRIMRTMRLIRALRGIRVIRLLRYVSALRTLVFSIVSTTGSLMWTLVLLSLLFYSFGVILTQIVSDHCRFEAIRITEDDNALPNCKDIDELLHRYWNDVPESVCTLFLAITGGLSWDDAFRPLRFSPLAVVLLVLYIIVTVFAVLNVVTGVFCNTAIESAQSDKDIAIMKQMRKHDAQVQALRHIFKEIDHDKSMHVTLAELKEALSAKKLSSFMESMGISTQDVSTLFMIIDTDKSGMIDLEEFVSGCMQLHGPAKSLQLAQMSHENRVTRQVIKHLANSISSIKKQMSSVLEFLEDRPVGTACAV